MTDEKYFADLAAEDAELTAEVERQLAFLETASVPGDLGEVLRLMSLSVLPGDDPRIELGIGAVRRITAASAI